MGCRVRHGSESYQSGVIAHLKQWFAAERMYGHAVSRSLLRDFYLKFLQREIAVKKGRMLQLADAAVEQQQEAKQLALEGGDGQLVVQAEEAVEAQASAVAVLEKAQSLQARQARLREDQCLLHARLRKMQSAKECREGKYLHSVFVRIGAHLRKPQRKTRLEPSQEWERVRLTWQSFDRAQYVAVSGTDEELLEQVPDPRQWRERPLILALCSHPADLSEHRSIPPSRFG